MRSARIAATVGLTLGVLTPVALARAPLTISNPDPTSIEQLGSDLNKIPPYLQQAQCGGWLDEKVETNAGSRVSYVEGLPGRNTQWDGDLLSGMATRVDEDGNGDVDDDFIRPDLTKGYSTSCDGSSRVGRSYWEQINNGYPFEIKVKNGVFPGPRFTDPVCRWRLEGGGTFPPVPLKPNSTLNYEQMGKNFEPQDRESPQTCRDFCLYVNRFQYLTCKDPVPVPKPDNPDEFYFVCNRWALVFLCTNEEVPVAPADFEQLNQNVLCPAHVANTNPNPGDPAPSELRANARSCKGESCYCPGPACPGESQGFRSFFRRYFGAYKREAVPKDGPPDYTKNSAAVACYGFYNEFDPKKTQTSVSDRRCVINMNVSFMKNQQRGKAQYVSSTPTPQIDPNNPANQRQGNQFNAEEDLWYENLTRGFSLLSEKMFHDEYDKNLSSVYLDLDHLDDAVLRSNEQISAQQPLAQSNQVRAFDDTGSGRIVATWWQKQQNEMAVLLHPPVIRLVLPSGWSFGVNQADPQLQALGKIVPAGDKRNESIELQTDSDEDILGLALSYLEQSMLLHTEEEPIPIVVAMGSPTEFRAKAQAWCTWYLEYYDAKNCDDMPQSLDKVKKLMAQLQTYADNIENARKLRSELPKYAAKMLSLQSSLTSPIGNWVKENLEHYKEVLQEQKNLRAGLLAQWVGVQSMMNNFTANINMPWCMNQRFTAPVYSLLDNWLPSRWLGGDISANGLPTITAQRPTDVVIDFSTIAYMTGSIKVPVLQPVQVRLDDIPWPPASRDPGLEKEYPDLPTLDGIAEALAAAAEDLPAPNQSLDPPPPLDLSAYGEEFATQASRQVATIARIVDLMVERYNKFWKSIGPLDPDDPTKNDRNGINQMKQRLECYSWDDKTCQHVEMDLIERFVRIGSRPLVMLNEDYYDIPNTKYDGSPKGFGDACAPGEDTCTPTVHPEDEKPREQWEIIGPKTVEQTFDDVRRAIQVQTYPRPVGNGDANNPLPFDTSKESLLPNQDVPQEIDLSYPGTE